jgi:hypothetical protein
LEKKTESKETVAKKPLKKKKAKAKAPAKKVQSKKTAPKTKKKPGKGGRTRPPKSSRTKCSSRSCINEGKKQGFLTYDQIYAFLPEDQQTAERFDDTIMLLDDQGIKVVDGTPTGQGHQKKARKKRHPQPQRHFLILERSRILSRCTCGKWAWLPC